MKPLTNKLNYPQPLYDAIANDPYDAGDSDISITGLIAPPRIRVLKKQFGEMLEEDVSDRVYSLFGQLMHGLLERANKTALAEERFYVSVQGPYEVWRVSGAMDAVYEDGILDDYKMMSFHKVSDGVPPEFEQQLNLYTVLLKHGKTKDGKTLEQLMGHKVAIKILRIVCLFRDWSQGKADGNEFMPQQQGLVLDVPKWTDKKALDFLKERVAIHQEAERALPECTDDERWKKADKWAVMARKGAARAAKLHDLKEDAEQHAARLGKPAIVEPRFGFSVRCQRYCAVSEHCEQYQTELKAILKEKDEKTKTKGDN